MKFARTIKEFAKKHETALSVVATTLVVSMIMTRSHREIDRFLLEKNLFNEFYTPEDI